EVCAVRKAAGGARTPTRAAAAGICLARAWRNRIGGHLAASGGPPSRRRAPDLFHHVEYWPHAPAAAAVRPMRLDRIRRLERRIEAVRQTRRKPQQRVFEIVVRGDTEPVQAALAQLRAEQGATDDDLIVVCQIVDAPGRV